MRFGHFDDAAREYVIETRGAYPINYLGTEISPRFPHGRRLLFLPRRAAASPDAVPLQRRPDRRGRSLLLRPRRRRLLDAGLGARQAGPRRVRVPGRPVVHEDHGRAEGHPAEVLYFVPLGTNAEVHRVTLRTPRGRESVKLSFVEFCSGTPGRQTNYQRTSRSARWRSTEGRSTTRPIPRAPQPLRRPLRERPVAGFDTDRESFLGLWNGFGEPQAVAEGKARNSVASGWSPIGSHQLAVDLARGGEDLRVRPRVRREPGRRQVGEAGVVNKKPARELLARFRTTAQADAASPRSATTGRRCCRSTP